MKRKREEKEQKNGDQIAKKSPCASFSSAQSSFFGSIRNTLHVFRCKIFFMQDFFSINKLCDF